MTEHIAIVTGEDAPDLSSDGRRLRATLRERGYDVSATQWRDPDVDWGAFDLALVRSCWKYYVDPEAFREWLRTAEEAGVAVRNPPDVVRWNLHKSYMRDLAARGVPVVPTEVVDPGTDRRLVDVLRDRGWDQAVVKPAIGTSSAGVWKTSRATAVDDQERFERRFPAARRVGDSASPDEGGERLSERDVLVQEFVPEVASGELSLVFFRGEFSHGWRSLRAPDGLGVEGAADGVERDYDPSPDTVESAWNVLAAATDATGVDPADLPYARVDCVEHDGEFRLMELELIEPYLALDEGDRAVESFATAVEGVLADAV